MPGNAADAILQMPAGRGVTSVYGVSGDVETVANHRQRYSTSPVSWLT